MTKWGHLVLSWFPFSSKAPSSDSAETRDSYAYLYPMRYNPPLEKSLTIKAVWGHFQLVWRNKNSLQGFPLIYAGYWLLLILPHLKPLGCKHKKTILDTIFGKLHNFPRCTQYHLLKAAVRDGNANMSVRNEIKAGKKANKFYRPKRPKRYCFTVLCPPFLNLKEFLARRREDCLSFPLWLRVSQGKFLFSTIVGLRYPMSQLFLKQCPRTIASKFAVLSLSWPQDDGLQANYVALAGYISSRVCLLIFAHRD